MAQTSTARRAVPLAVGAALLLGVLAGAALIDGPTAYTCDVQDGASAPMVSRPGGFHDAPFELEVLPRDALEPLYYTLDGSHPDPEDNPDATRTYDGPIRVGDRTAEPNRLARIRTEIDRAAFAEGRSGPATWDVAAPGIHKATVMRARGLTGGECVVVYFVGEHLRRSDLPVAHLALDPGFLFDDDEGIYVPGARFAAHLASDDFDPAGPPWRAPGNYHQPPGSAVWCCTGSRRAVSWRTAPHSGCGSTAGSPGRSRRSRCGSTPATCTATEPSSTPSSAVPGPPATGA